LPRLAIAGASSPTSTNGTLTLIANTASMSSSAMDTVGPMGEDRRIIDQDVDVPVAQFGGSAGQFAG
jgi:hypothetical protein